MSSLHDLSLEEKRKLAITMLSQEHSRKTGALKTFNLYSHPFGLASLEPRFPLTYLGAESSRGSLEQMCYYLQLNIASFGEVNKDNIKALRIIYGQESNPNKHLVYFEALTTCDYYMCGETTNFSGTGSDCKERLEIIFDYLADLAGIKVKKVDVNFTVHKRAKSLIGSARRADCAISRKNNFFDRD